MMNKLRFLSLSVAAFLTPVSLAATETALGTGAAVTGLINSISTAPEDMLAQRLSNHAHIRGDFGEVLASRAVLKRELGAGGWKEVTPRTGRQGLDHIFMRLDANGSPVELMVGESKYGTAQLGKTADGRQMSAHWQNARLVAMANRYQEFATARPDSIRYAEPPLRTRYKLDVHYPDGRTRVFWRHDNKSPWFFSGSSEELRLAQSYARSYSDLLRGAGTGTIAYKSRLFHVSPVDGVMHLSVYDAAGITDASGGYRNLKLLERVSLPGYAGRGKVPVSLNDNVALALQKVIPDLADDEARTLATSVRNRMFLTPDHTDYSRMMMKTTAGAGLLAAALDSGLQLAMTGEVSTLQTSQVFGLTALSMHSSQKLETYLLRHSTLRRSMGSFGSLSSGARFLRGSVAAAAIFSAVDVFASLSGNLPWEQTGRNALVAGGGAAGGAIGVSGVMLLASQVGTAGTGAAISSLHGIAATNATMAWLGGGTLASGGGGMAAGAWVAAAAGAAVAIVVAGGVYVILDIVDTAGQRSYLETFREVLHPDASSPGWIDSNWRKLHPPVKVDEVLSF